MKHFGKRMTFFKDESLEEFRGRIERGELSAHYNIPDNGIETECIGICNSQE